MSDRHHPFAPGAPRPLAAALGGWLESDSWAARSARTGSLRYSELGPRSCPQPEVPAMAGWLAARLDDWWESAGQPDPFVAAVVSGDDGSLAAAVLDRSPRCNAALRYVMVGGPGAARPAETHRLVQVPIEDPAFLFPPAAPPGPDDESVPPATGIGPLVTWLPELPVVADTGTADPDSTVIVALQVLSCLPFDLYRLCGKQWCEVRLAARDMTATTGTGMTMAELEVPARGGRQLPGHPGPAAELVHQTGAAAWLRRVVSGAHGGRLAVVDRWGKGAPAAGPAADLLLEAAQLARVRAPAGPPEPIGSSGLASVDWNLGHRP